MANAFSQSYIQLVFAVKNKTLIDASWEENLYTYISGLVKKKEQQMVVINGMPDHIHLLLRVQSSCCIASLAREIKKSSDLYIKEQKFTSLKFQWQEGYGAFSVSISGMADTVAYINTQADHHKTRSFQEEFIAFLERHNMKYDERHVWG